MGSDDLESRVYHGHLPGTAEENIIKESLTHEELRKYCVNNKWVPMKKMRFKDI